jgi:hypothetical protein
MQSIGKPRILAVAKLADAQALRRATSIPTAALAARRFEVAVLSSRADWFAGGPLSDIHVAMLFSGNPDNLEEDIRSSLKRFSFADPWSPTRKVELGAVLAVVELSRFEQCAEAFAEVDVRLGAASADLSPADQLPNRVERWCHEWE